LLRPVAWMDAGLTTNRGVFFLGQPGTGRSSGGKRTCRGLMAFVAVPLFLGDAKPDYTRLVRSAGGWVVRIGRGLDRINPLDAGPLGAALARMSGPAADRLRLELRGQRLSTTLAPCALVRTEAPMSNAEETVIGAAVDLLADRRGGRSTGKPRTAGQAAQGPLPGRGWRAWPAPAWGCGRCSPGR
jgi:hypothetical protein